MPSLEYLQIMPRGSTKQTMRSNPKTQKTLMQTRRLLPLAAISLLLTLTGCQTVETKDNASLSAHSISFLGELEAVDSTQKDFSHFGVQYNGMPFHLDVEFDSLDVDDYLSQIPITAQAASELGLKWARVSVDWSSVEDNNGEFHWEILDETIAQLTKKEIEIYLCLHGGHREHTSFDPPVTEEQLLAWENFARKIIDRYKDRIDYWEIWNEGNSVWFWGDDPDAAEYMQLVRRTSAVINELDPGAKIVGGNLARLDLPYAEELFEFGIADYIDVFTFHPYGHFPEGIVRKIGFQARTPDWYQLVDHQVEDLLAIVAATGKDIEVWQGECGYPSQMNGMGWNGTGPWSDRIQSKWIMRRALVDLSFNSNVSTYFLMKEAKNLGREAYNYKGLLRYADNHRKPAFYAYQNVIAALPGRLTSVKDHEAAVDIVQPGSFPGVKDSDIMTVLLRDEQEKPYFAYWLVLRMQDAVEPGHADVTIQGVKLEKPVLVNLMTGQRFSIDDFSHDGNATILRNLPVADYPFIITE